MRKRDGEWKNGRGCRVGGKVRGGGVVAVERGGRRDRREVFEVN